MPLVATKMKPSDFLEIEDALDHNFAGDALALSSAEFFLEAVFDFSQRLNSQSFLKTRLTSVGTSESESCR